MNKSFTFSINHLSVLDKMTNEQAGMFIKAIYEYQTTGVLPTLDFAIEMAIMPIIKQFEADKERLSIIRIKRAEAGAKGGKQKVANATKKDDFVANATNFLANATSVVANATNGSSKCYKTPKKEAEKGGKNGLIVANASNCYTPPKTDVEGASMLETYNDNLFENSDKKQQVVANATSVVANASNCYKSPAPSEKKTKYINNNINNNIYNNIYNNNIYNNSEILKKNIFNFKEKLLEIVDDEILVSDYLALRKLKKASISETVFNNLIKQCNDNNFEVKEALRVIIDKNWMGFKYEWVANAQKNNNINRQQNQKRDASDILLERYGIK